SFVDYDNSLAQRRVCTSSTTCIVKSHRLIGMRADWHEGQTCQNPANDSPHLTPQKRKVVPSRQVTVELVLPNRHLQKFAPQWKYCRAGDFRERIRKTRHHSAVGRPIDFDIRLKEQPPERPSAGRSLRSGVADRSCEAEFAGPGLDEPTPPVCVFRLECTVGYDLQAAIETFSAV